MNSLHPPIPFDAPIVIPEGFKEPMLAGLAPKALEKISYPILLSRKLDGFRITMINGRALTRSFKPLPNDFARNWCEANLPNGFDGELMMRDLTLKFDVTSGNFRRRSGEPDFVYCAFDWIDFDNLDEPFTERYKSLLQWFIERLEGHVMMVEQIKVDDADEARALHDEWRFQGFEGSMFRKISGRYKTGRSTTKEGLLLKNKPWIDEEATIIGFVEEMKNNNVATVSATGKTKRSSHKENKVGKGRLGTLRCRFDDGTEFGVGTGLNNKTRKLIWDNQEKYLNLRAKVKSQPAPGMTEREPNVAPRIPVFLGIRDPSLD